MKREWKMENKLLFGTLLLEAVFHSLVFEHAHVLKNHQIAGVDFQKKTNDCIHFWCDSLLILLLTFWQTIQFVKLLSTSIFET